MDFSAIGKRYDVAFTALLDACLGDFLMVLQIGFFLLLRKQLLPLLPLSATLVTAAKVVSAIFPARDHLTYTLL